MPGKNPSGQNNKQVPYAARPYTPKSSASPESALFGSKKEFPMPRASTKKDTPHVYGSVFVPDVRKFLKTAEGQIYIRDKFNIQITPGTKEYFDKIKELSDTITKKFESHGTVFDPDEERALDSETNKTEKFFREKENLRKEAEDGVITYQETVDREHRKKIRPVMDDLTERFKR